MNKYLYLTKAQIQHLLSHNLFITLISAWTDKSDMTLVSSFVIPLFITFCKVTCSRIVVSISGELIIVCIIPNKRLYTYRCLCICSLETSCLTQTPCSLFCASYTCSDIPDIELPSKLGTQLIISHKNSFKIQMFLNTCNITKDTMKYYLTAISYSVFNENKLLTLLILIYHMPMLHYN